MVGPFSTKGIESGLKFSGAIFSHTTDTSSSTCAMTIVVSMTVLAEVILNDFIL